MAAFLVANLGMISDFKLSNALNTTDEMYSADDYVNRINTYYSSSLLAIETMMIYENNPGVINPFRDVVRSAQGIVFCEMTVYDEDLVLNSVSNKQETMDRIDAECMSVMGDRGNVNSVIKPNIFNYLRDATNSLKHNQTIPFKKILQKDINYITVTETLWIYLRFYYSYFRDKYISPLISFQITNALFICIIFFISNVILDVLCLMIIKYFILSGITESNKILLNLLNIVKN